MAGTKRQPQAADCASGVQPTRASEFGIFADCDKVPTVVTSIPVIHRLLTEFFTFATRIGSAWCSCDRDGGSSLPRAAGPKVPISAGRQCRSSFGSGRGVSREEAPEESIFLKRDAAPGFPDPL